MTDFIRSLFSSDGFMPHGHCYFWTKSLIALHGISDAFIVLAYYSIPFTLVYFARKRKDLQFHWMFVCFAVFILACGTTHLMEIWNIWHASYWLSGSIKALTALASVPTAILLVKLVPHALALPSPSALQKAHDELELRVRERTAELEQTARTLETEIAVRRQAEEDSKRSQRLLQDIVDNSMAVIYVKDLQGHYLLVNRRFSELFHVSKDAIAGKTDHDIFPKPAADAFRDMDQRVAAARETLVEEETAPHDDGPHTYVSVKGPLRDATGNAHAIFGISTDITERKQTEDALRASEERTRLIIETALDAVITIDRNGVIAGWSPQAEKTFGWTIQEVQGRSLAETIIPGRYRDAHQRGMADFLATGHGPVLNKRVELSALHRDGREFPIELAITPIQVSGQTTFSAFVRDISERRQAEDALRQSEERFRTLAESLPQLVWTCRPDGYCDYLSRQWVEYTGSPAEMQIGYGWAEHLHPEDRERARVEWEKATHRGDVFDVEFRIRRADGVYRWFKTRAVPLRDASERIVKWFGSNTDFEDFKQSEQKLRTHLGRLDLLHHITRAIGERQDLGSILQVVIRSLEENLPIDFSCVCLHDPIANTLKVAGVGVKSAPIAMELAMAEQAIVPIDENSLSRCVRGQLVYEPDISQAKSPFPQRLARGGLLALVVAPLQVESKVFGVLIAARRAAHSFSSGECEFLKQLSEHVALASHQSQLHGALQQAYEDLRQTQQAVMQQERLRALGQMASGIAHDINNAISPASLYTQALLEREPNLSDRARNYLETIRHAIDDVAATVARMREFYRQREPQLTLVSLDLNRLASQVVDLTRARWSDMPQHRGIVIELATEFGTGLPGLSGVESDIREALINLVFNAVDAMPEGGTLTLRTKVVENDSARRIQIEVIDTGVGMTPETRRLCLEPFFTTKGERGTGLGLAMVYGMVKRHGAEIEIESEVGKGTTVRLSFDAPADSLIGTDEPARAVAVPPRLRILIVDDDPLLLKSLRDTLEEDGHVIVTANGGAAGIETFRASQSGNEPFSVVITDLGMPYVDGRKVADAVKGISPSTPVILLTGWGQRLVDDKDIPAHVDQVLNKPPVLLKLREALARCCKDAKALEISNPETPCLTHPSPEF
jgi:PAS domain S-box-containing protein